MLLLLYTFYLLIHTCNSGCPFANQMSSYNFTGQWNHTYKNISYIFNVCHLPSSEIFFTITKQLKPNIIIGYGGGNWSNEHMALIGKKIELINYTSTGYSIFAMGMNQQKHQWWYQDNYKSISVNELNKNININNKYLCGIPYGINIRNNYWKKYWDSFKEYQQIYFIKKRKIRRDLANKQYLKNEKNKKWYNRIRDYDIWKNYLMEISNDMLIYLGFKKHLSKMDEMKIKTEKRSNEINKLNNLVINEIGKFKFNEIPKFPTLKNTIWKNEKNEILKIVDINETCLKNINDKTIEIYDIKMMYDGVGMIGKYNGGSLMFLQMKKNEMIGSIVDSELEYQHNKWFKFDSNVDIKCQLIYKHINTTRKEL